MAGVDAPCRNCARVVYILRGLILIELLSGPVTGGGILGYISLIQSEQLEHESLTKPVGL